MSNLATMMQRAGLLSEGEATRIRSIAYARDVPLVEVLIDRGLTTENDLVKFLQSKLMIPEVEADLLEQLERETLRHLPAELAWEHEVLPVSVDDVGNMTLAMSDPTDLQAVDAITAHTGAYLVRAVAPLTPLRRALERYYGSRNPEEDDDEFDEFDITEPSPPRGQTPAPAPAPARERTPTPAPVPTRVETRVRMPTPAPVVKPVEDEETQARDEAARVEPQAAAPTAREHDTSASAAVQAETPAHADEPPSPITPEALAPEAIEAQAVEAEAPAYADAPPAHAAPDAPAAPIRTETEPTPVATMPEAAQARADALDDAPTHAEAEGAPAPDDREPARTHTAPAPVAEPPAPTASEAAPPPTEAVAAEAVAAEAVAAAPTPEASAPAPAASAAADPSAAGAALPAGAAPPAKAPAPPPRAAGVPLSQFRRNTPLPEDSVTPLSPTAFARVLPRLVAAADRDEITRVLLDFLGEGFSRVIMFVHLQQQLRGRDARGDDLLLEAVTQVRIPTTGPSLFREVIERGTPHFGPWRHDSKINQAFDQAMGTIRGNVLVLPVRLRERVPLLVYASGINHPVDPRSINELVDGVSGALERLIFRRKSQDTLIPRS